MKKWKVVRYSILLCFLLLFTVFSVRHFIFGGDKAASVDALCPFGGFETLYTWIATGNLVPRIMVSSLILAFGILLTVIFFRKGFCGHICPFGTIQELLYKTTKKKITIKKQIETETQVIKYFILAAILIGTAYTGTLVFRNYDPFVTFFHFGKGLIWDYSAIELTSHLPAFILMIIILVLAIFIERVWCRYLCPLGATMNIASFITATKIRRNKKTCISCSICDKVCPMNIQVSDVSYIKDIECINCNQCVSQCPRSSLSVTFFGRDIKPLTYTIMIITIFFSVIAVAHAFSIWQSVPGTSIKDSTGTINPDNIQGWMTLEDISQETGIPQDTLKRDLNLPLDIDLATPMNKISSLYGIDFHTEFVREYLRNQDDSTDCPYNIHDDQRPGLCGLYIDNDDDNICDLSQ